MLNSIQQLSKELIEHKLKLVTAESCTGGGVAYYLTDLPGSSAWFERGFVTYSNASKKELLQVKAATLLEFGAVSEQTAREMAEGALKNSHAQVSIAITGIAGPEGGTTEKPVGTVWFAWAGVNKETQASVWLLQGNRQVVREQAIKIAIKKLREFISQDL
jgi:nicotinamide-nucleotide amidase